MLVAQQSLLCIHEAFPCSDQTASIFQCWCYTHNPKLDARHPYHIFYITNCSPMGFYFLIDLTISVNFFKPPVCSNNVPITKPSAPAWMMEDAIFAVFMPPPTMRNPSKTLLTVFTISGVIFCLAPEPASRYTNHA